MRCQKAVNVVTHGLIKPDTVTSEERDVALGQDIS